MERVTVYVDGFNFYYGLKRMKAIDSDWKKFYWIDFVKFFDHFLLQNQTLQKVVYFTTPSLNIHKSQRQSLLLKANRLINEKRFEVVKGKFYDKEIICPNCSTKIIKPEEKRTDVNIAVQMMGDCALNSVDTLVLVCADSDLVPPLEFIKKHYPNKKIRIYFPPDNYSSALNDFMRYNKGKVVRLEKNKIKFTNSIMPDVVTKNNLTYTIPPNWKI
jgi:uncharacterized LabA/DUF88 family protein